MKKVKVGIRDTSEFRDFSNKVYRNHFGELEEFGADQKAFDLPVDDKGNIVVDNEVFAEAMSGADWSSDGGTGRAILLRDGREIVSPIPLAPPVSISNGELSVNELVERALKRHYEQLKDNDEVDGPDDFDDFGEDEEPDPSSIYEFTVLSDEAPAIPDGVDVDADDVDKVEKDAEKVVKSSVPSKKKKAVDMPPPDDES